MPTWQVVTRKKNRVSEMMAQCDKALLNTSMKRFVVYTLDMMTKML